MTNIELEKIENVFTKEEFEILLYYKEHLLEFKELARKKVKNEFVKPMRASINKNIKKLENNKDVKRETINLLIQSKNTLKNVHRLIINNSIVDANTLLRSSFENLAMGMVINNNDDVYNEFLNLSITPDTRNYTEPLNVRKKFIKILDKNCNISAYISKTQLHKALDEMYKKLCNFIHSSLIVSLTVELAKDDNNDINIFALKQNSYFLEILLCLSLEYLNNVLNNSINKEYMVVGWFVILFDINIEKLQDLNNNGLKDLLYYDTNQSFFEHSKHKGDNLKEAFDKLLLDLNENSIDLIEIFKEIIE